jgi:isopenicillin N synthase-like dioxygenase
VGDPTKLPDPNEMAELARERDMGGEGSETSEREIRRIDLSDFEARRAEITEELWDAALEVGFFQLVNHGIDPAQIERAFALTRELFSLPDETKAGFALQKGRNAGWESRSQVRPSVATPDQKESYQLTRPFMDGLWPDPAALPDFRPTMLAFEATCRDVAMQVLSCFADRLGFERDVFTAAHDPGAPGYQSTLRLLHYFAVDPEAAGLPGVWRAGAHTDFDCLTLLFQTEGQGGLQVCPGREADGQEWTAIAPTGDTITCNIGDMLMRWSDDVLPSNFHRVKSPSRHQFLGDRYSIAFFAQADQDVVIRGPLGKYPQITAGDYLAERVRANYSAAAGVSTPAAS